MENPTLITITIKTLPFTKWFIYSHPYMISNESYNTTKFNIYKSYSDQNSQFNLFGKDLDDLLEIITNDDSTELIQRIHLKNQIENMT